MNKRIVLAIFIVCGLMGTVHAATVGLTWDANPPEDKVKYYKVAWGNYSGNSKVFSYQNYTTVTATAVEVKVSELQKWFFRVSAVNDSAESLYSNVVEVLFIRTPKNLKFQRIDVR